MLSTKVGPVQDEAIIIHDGKGGFQTARLLYAASDGRIGNASRRIGLGFRRETASGHVVRPRL